MTNDKNVSPSGWYIASYVLRFVVVNEVGNDDPNRRFMSWENTVIVKAGSLDEAYDKVVAIGTSNTEPYKGGDEGIDVQWIFEGLTELLPVYEEIEDGSELMWADHSPKKLKTIQSWILSKGEFHQ